MSIPVRLVKNLTDGNAPPIGCCLEFFQGFSFPSDQVQLLMPIPAWLSF
jgi:hypothetical protein